MEKLPCECQQPCNSTSYIASLSYASIESSAQISHNQLARMEDDFKKSFDIHIRTSDNFPDFMSDLHGAVYLFKDLEEEMMRTVSNWIYNFEQYEKQLYMSTEALHELVYNDIFSIIPISNITKNSDKLFRTFNSYLSDSAILESMLQQMQEHEQTMQNHIQHIPREEYTKKTQYIANMVVNEILVLEDLLKLDVSFLAHGMAFHTDSCWETLEKAAQIALQYIWKSKWAKVWHG